MNKVQFPRARGKYGYGRSRYKDGRYLARLELRNGEEVRQTFNPRHYRHGSAAACMAAENWLHTTARHLGSQLKAFGPRRPLYNRNPSRLSKTGINGVSVNAKNVAASFAGKQRLGVDRPLWI